MVIPQLGPNREIITPHKVAVVILILEYYKKDVDTVWLPKYSKKFGLFLLKQNNGPDLTYRHLNNLIKSEAFCLHPQHISLFESYLEKLVASDKEMLYEFYQSLDKFIVSVEINGKSAAVNESSIVFLYLRRFMIAMQRMSLMEELSLYQAICEYYRKGLRAITLSSGGPSTAHDDDTTAMVDFTEMKQNQSLDEGREFRRWNRKQIELFVGQQFNKLEYNESSALPPKLLQATINEIIEDNPRYSPAYYLDYLNSLRVGDLFGCVEKIHRCFDVNEQRPISGKPGKGYQYYALNLAMLHARFGHRQLALNCLRESIMLAQEAGDRECIELGENWRQFLRNSKSSTIKGGGGATSGDFQSQQATSFTSISNQLVAKKFAIQGSSRKALQIVSETVNYNNSLMVASNLALKSAIYNQMGKHDLSALNSQLLLNCPLKTYGHTLSGEPLCISLVNVAGWLGAQGNYDQAAVLFKLAGETHQNAGLKKQIARTELQVSIDQFLEKKQWGQATGLCQKLHTYDETEKGIKLAKLNVERGNFPTATAILEKLMKKREHLSPLTRTQLNILQLEVMLGQQSSVDYESVNLAVKALHFAEMHNLSYETALIEVFVARIHLVLGQPTFAKTFIEKALLKILADGTLVNQGESLWVYVKTLLTIVPKGDSERMSQLLTREVVQVLDVVVQIFTKLDFTAKLKRIYLFLARLANEFNLREERNRFAFKFKQLVLENAAGGGYPFD